MDALSFIVLDDNIPFSVSLALMALLGLVSALGLDIDGADGHDGIEVPLLDWMNPGRMPMLASLTIVLCVYGVLGLAGQQAMVALLGHTADALPAGAAAVLPAAFAARGANRLVAPFMPRDETSAISIQELVGRRGNIEIGTATSELPARARFVDDHGQMHMVMVRPNDPAESLRRDQEILLVSYEDGEGRAIAVEPRNRFGL